MFSPRESILVSPLEINCIACFHLSFFIKSANSFNMFEVSDCCLEDRLRKVILAEGCMWQLFYIKYECTETTPGPSTVLLITKKMHFDVDQNFPPVPNIIECIYFVCRFIYACNTPCGDHLSNLRFLFCSPRAT